MKNVMLMLLVLLVAGIFACFSQSAFADAAAVPAQIDAWTALLNQAVAHWQAMAVMASAVVFDLVQRFRPTANPQGLFHTISAIAYALSRLLDSVGKAIDSVIGQNIKQ